MIRNCSVQLTQSCLTLCDPMNQASLSITNSQSIPKLMSIELVMPSNHLIFCRPLLLPSIFPNIRVFSNDSALHIRWPKYWSFSFSICPSNEHPGLMSFRTDWLDLLAVQGTLKESSPTPQFKSINSLPSAFFIVQLSDPYMFSPVTQLCSTFCNPKTGAPCPSPTPGVYPNSCPLSQ